MESFTIDQQEQRIRRLRQRIRAFVDLAGDKSQAGYLPGRWAMLTCTYAAVDGWSPLDITCLLKCLRAWAARRGIKIGYTWVAELQERGAVHYHVLIKLPKGFTIPMPDKQGWWKGGSTKIEWVRKSGKRYLSKYCQKVAQKVGQFPKHCRLHGAGGLPEQARAWWRFLCCPQWLKGLVEVNDFPRRVAGGFRLACGAFLSTPFVGQFIPDKGQVVLRRKSWDEWNNDCQFPDAWRTEGARANAGLLVQEWAEKMWQHGAETFQNPWRGYLLGA